ncbi:metallophosphoesterase family protein [Nocardia goodfellowii]
MRILHTSDWHIGFIADGVSLLPAQQRMLEEIRDIASEVGANVVVVSGDVYDKENPSEAEIAVVQAAFERMACIGHRLIVTAGNHDSAVRLGAGAMFASFGDLHLRTTVEGIGYPVIVNHLDGKVAFYAIPCLHFARRELGVPPGRPYADYWRAAMARVRADLATRPGVRAVVVAHAPVADPAARGLARLRAGGSQSTVPVDVFDGVDYVALGDLHWPHAVSPSVWYSGSPLPYVYNNLSRRIDFDPPKSVAIVDIGPDGLQQVEAYPLPMPKGTVQVVGSLLELAEREGSYDYVCAALTDPARPVGAWRQLRQRFPYLIRVDWINPDTGQAAPILWDELEPEAVVDDLPAEGEPWRGFYSQLGDECLRCGAPAEHPCFQIRCEGGASTNRTYHAERGSTAAELAELGYVAYEVADDDGVRRRLWHDPRDGQMYVKRAGCNAVLPGQREEPASARVASRREPRSCAYAKCGIVFVPQRVGRPAEYHTPACRIAAHRERKQDAGTT